MARKGDYTALNSDQLAGAFANARSQQADYVVVMTYQPFGPATGANFIYSHEKAFPVSRDTAAADLTAIFKQCESTYVRRVYETSSEQAGDLSMLPAGAYEEAKAAAAPPAPRPLWKRALGLK